MILDCISVVDKKVSAPAFILQNQEKFDLAEVRLPKGEFILVCESTSPAMLPIMLRAKGVVTTNGGLLSHSAIVAREFNIPTITGVRNAVDEIKTGDLLTLDNNRVIVGKIND